MLGRIVGQMHVVRCSRGMGVPGVTRMGGRHARPLVHLKLSLEKNDPCDQSEKECGMRIWWWLCFGMTAWYWEVCGLPWAGTWWGLREYFGAFSYTSFW